MPLFEYQCIDCHARDQRIAGLDDYTARCVQCGGLMLRISDPFGFIITQEEKPPCAKP